MKKFWVIVAVWALLLVNVVLAHADGFQLNSGAQKALDDQMSDQQNASGQQLQMILNSVAGQPGGVPDTAHPTTLQDLMLPAGTADNGKPSDGKPPQCTAATGDGSGTGKGSSNDADGKDPGTTIACSCPSDPNTVVQPHQPVSQACMNKDTAAQGKQISDLTHVPVGGAPASGAPAGGAPAGGAPAGGAPADGGAGGADPLGGGMGGMGGMMGMMMPMMMMPMMMMMPLMSLLPTLLSSLQNSSSNKNGTSNCTSGTGNTATNSGATSGTCSSGTTGTTGSTGTGTAAAGNTASTPLMSSLETDVTNLLGGGATSGTTTPTVDTSPVQQEQTQLEDAASNASGTAAPAAAIDPTQDRHGSNNAVDHRLSCAMSTGGSVANCRTGTTAAPAASQ